MTKTVVVVGAGVAGIQASQQLADLGVTVHLIEREASVGGLSTHLGRVFPTDDCALCHDACEELFGGYHRRCQYRTLLGGQRRLNLHTQTQVKSIRREGDVFSVFLRTSPRHVLLDRCVVCLECIQVCDVEVEDAYNLQRSKRKAIYRPIPQGVPLAPLIDMDSCNRCNKCVEICEVGAINLDQRAKARTIKVDAIVLATGVEEKSPVALPGYGYGKCEDVLTQRELARLLDPAGGTSGQVLTADGELAKSVSMILCAGSRDLNVVQYCSKACCSYSLKHAVMLRKLGIDVNVCYMDLRVPVHSHHYLEQAKELGVKFIRGKPDHVTVRDGSPVTVVEDTESRKRLEIKSDLVVLASPLIPHASQQEDFTGFLDEYGFSRCRSEKAGVYACGTSTGPADIPTSIAEANAVALEVYTDLMGVSR